MGDILRIEKVGNFAGVELKRKVAEKKRVVTSSTATAGYVGTRYQDITLLFPRADCVGKTVLIGEIYTKIVALENYYILGHTQQMIDNNILSFYTVHVAAYHHAYNQFGYVDLSRIAPNLHVNYTNLLPMQLVDPTFCMSSMIVAALNGTSPTTDTSKPFHLMDDLVKWLAAHPPLSVDVTKPVIQ